MLLAGLTPLDMSRRYGLTREIVLDPPLATVRNLCWIILPHFEIKVSPISENRPAIIT